jgi:uncharacterized protein YndB with AHSA1/START domain
MATATAQQTAIHFEAASEIHAPTATVWDILTDYRNGHPRILPPAFSGIQIESGGKGAGTVYSYSFHAAGTTRHIRHEVREPEPGHILVESAPGDPTTTTFTLTPTADGAHTHLLITTDLTTQPGLTGTLTRLLAPLLAPTMRGIYLDEMQRLDDLAQRWPIVAKD